MNKRIYMANIVSIIILAICSTVAVFADVESTGNLSMALNGAGVTQLIVCVALAYLYFQQLKNSNSIWNRQSTREKIGYAMVAVIFAICMIIGKEQTAHEDLKFGIFAIVMFLGYVPAFYLLVSFCGDWFGKRAEQSTLREPNGLTEWLFEKHVVLGVMVVIFVCRLPYLLAFFPCSMSWDGGAQISNFYGLEIFTNHHPPFVSFFYGAIAWYSQKWGIANLGMFLISLMQTALTSVSVAQVCVVLKKMKSPYWMRWGVVAYFALFTVWSIFDVTVIKDSLYYPFTMLFAVQVIYCLFFQEEFFGKKRNIVLLVLYAVLMTQIRNNGIFVVLFTLPFAIIAMPNKKKIFMGGVMVAILGITTLLNSVVYPMVGVISLESKVDTYCILFQQTAKYAIEHPEDVTDEERAVLDKLFDYDELPNVYEPHLADWVKNCLREQEGSVTNPTGSHFAALKKDYLKVWFAQFLRHPLTYIDAFFECSYGYYYPEVGTYKEGLGFYEEERYMFTASMSDAKQIEQLAPARFLLEQLSKLEYVPGIGMLYRAGFYAWCVIFAVVYFVVQKKYKALIVAIPAVVNILVCMISPVNTCIRYAMPTMCMVPIIWAVMWYQGRKN